MGKGAEGPDDEVAKADAILEAVVCRDRAESDSRMLLHAKSVGGGLKAITQQVEDLHAFFQQPFQVVIDTISSSTRTHRSFSGSPPRVRSGSSK